MKTLALDQLPQLLLLERTRRGLGLRPAAREAGVSFATIWRAERGELGVVKSVEALARWVGLELVMQGRR